jgi:antitoxin component of MazEF toxin-antitoxin module
MRFAKTAKKNGNSLCLIIPNELVRNYEIKEGDLIEVDLIRNHRDSIKE